MASSPTYNPNLIIQRRRLREDRRRSREPAATVGAVRQRDAGPLSAGLDVQDGHRGGRARHRRAYTPTSPFYDPGYCIDTASEVKNASNPDQTGRRRSATSTLAEGFEHSINSVFCKVGMHIGGREDPRLREALRLLLGAAARHAARREPRRAASTTRASSSRPNDPATADRSRAGSRSARSGCWSTPLQMALVAATIADGGLEPKPYLVQKVVAADGSIVTKTAPQTLGRAIKPQTAAELNQMMQLVVTGRNGRGRRIPRRVSTSPARPERRSSASATSTTRGSSCFAPADDPQVAVAVVVEKQPNGFGATCRGADREGHPRKAPARLIMSLRFRRPWPRATPSSTRSSTGATGSCASSAPAGWPTSTSPRTQELGRRVAIKILDRPPRERRRSSSSASGARRRTPPRSTIRTSSRSTTAARPRTPTTSRWSTSTGARSRSSSSGAGPRRSTSRSSTRARSSRRSASRTGTGSSTATSSRTTSSSTARGASRSRTSESRARARAR